MNNFNTNMSNKNEKRRDSSAERKDKKVHFSIIKGNSFEDLQNARKDKVIQNKLIKGKKFRRIFTI